MTSQHASIIPVALLVNVLMDIEVMASNAVKSMSVPRKLTSVTLMPIVTILMEVTIVNVLMDGEVTASSVPISTNVRKILIIVMAWQGA